MIFNESVSVDSQGISLLGIVNILLLVFKEKKGENILNK